MPFLRTASIASTSTTSPSVTREDRYTLQYIGNHRSLLTSVVIDNREFSSERTSVTRSVSNPVSSALFELQTLSNLQNLILALDESIRSKGRVFKEEGTLYNDEFPDALKKWMLLHPYIPGEYARKRRAHDLESVDKEMVKAIIAQLIALVGTW